MKKPKKQKPNPPNPARSGGESADSPASSSRASRDTRFALRDVGGEPVAGRASVPVLLIALLGTLIYFGDIYVIEHGGELDARVQQPFRIVKDLDDLQPKSDEDRLRARGQQVYSLYCAACHMADGNGNPSGSIPPLAGSDWVNVKDPNRIIRIVLNGLQGPVVVNDKTWGAVSMVSWRDAVNDNDVAAVLTYVRSSWGNKAAAVKGDDVKKIREETKAKKIGDQWIPWTADELMTFPLKE